MSGNQEVGMVPSRLSSQLPECKIHPSLDSLLQDPTKDEPQVAFDNYEAERAFKSFPTI